MNTSQWEKIKLNDALDALIDYRGKTPKKTEQGIPLITAKIVKNGFIQEPNEFIAEEDYSTWMVRDLPQIGDVVLTVEAPLGEVAQLNDSKVALAQRIVTLRGKKDVLDNGYLKYFLQSDIGQSRLKERETGTTVTGIKQSELRLVEINLPPYTIQKRIASILSSIDEKIELNRQITQTLEAIAQAIFKEWFVDFNFPGTTGEMQESDLGEIPKGWQVGTLGDVCRNTRNGIHPKNLKSETPYLGLEHIQRKNLSIPDWGSSADVDSQKFGFKKGDILFGKLRPYFHKVGIAPVDGICSTDILVIEPLEKEFYSFVVNHLFDEKLITHLSAIADGTRMPRVDWKSIREYRIVLPDKLIIQKFDKTVSEFYNQILLLIEENKALTLLRESLLPKLMKGEVSLNEQSL